MSGFDRDDVGGGVYGGGGGMYDIMCSVPED